MKTGGTVGAGGEGRGVTVYWEFQFRKKKGSWQWMGGWAHHSVNVL